MKYERLMLIASVPFHSTLKTLDCCAVLFVGVTGKLGSVVQCCPVELGFAEQCYPSVSLGT